MQKMMYKNLKIAVIVSLFNRPITAILQDGAIQRLLKYGVSNDNIVLITVPGAIEIPITAQYIATKNTVDVIIALGAVIRGETNHYDYVCQQVSYGCQRVALDHTLPVIFGILTTDNETQAWERIGGIHGHKGIESADCAIDMYNIFQQGCKL